MGCIRRRRGGQLVQQGGQTKCIRTRRPKKQLDGGGLRTGQWLVAGEQGRDPSAANQAENLVDGRTRRFKVFLRRLRLRSKERRSPSKNSPPLFPSLPLEALPKLRHVQTPP